MKFKMKDYGFITDTKTTNEDGSRDRVYFIWKSMVHRCYNKNHPTYKWYGKKGTIICDEWKRYSEFKNFYIKNNPTGELHMDKDIIGKNIYSQETVIFIKKSENSKDATSRRDYKLFTGIGNSMSKPYQYYSTNHTLRNTFKVACKNQGWNFNDFVEIYSGEKTGHNKRYFYMLMEINDRMSK